jgi:hypothetical protein
MGCPHFSCTVSVLKMENHAAKDTKKVRRGEWRGKNREMGLEEGRTARGRIFY